MGLCSSTTHLIVIQFDCIPIYYHYVIVCMSVRMAQKTAHELCRHYEVCMVWSKAWRGWGYTTSTPWWYPSNASSGRCSLQNTKTRSLVWSDSRGSLCDSSIQAGQVTLGSGLCKECFSVGNSWWIIWSFPVDATARQEEFQIFTRS